MNKLEKNSTSFGVATISWLIDPDSPKNTAVFKRMKSVVKLLDQVTTYEELYNALKLLRPKEYYKIVEVVIDGEVVFMRLSILEEEETNNVRSELL